MAGKLIRVLSLDGESQGRLADLSQLLVQGVVA
jgi:hypothetical protein